MLSQLLPSKQHSVNYNSPHIIAAVGFVRNLLSVTFKLYVEALWLADTGEVCKLLVLWLIILSWPRHTLALP